jgi:uncharacterized integral membrane protein
VLKNLWIYRRMVLLAMLLGLILWFIVINNQRVEVVLPFGLGAWETRSGIAILMGAVAGAAAASLGLTVFWALNRRGPRRQDDSEPAGPVETADDRPPADYAAKTGDGFPDAPWGGR